MKKRKLSRIIAVAIIAALTMTSFIGCGNESSKTATSSSSAEEIQDSIAGVETKLTNAKLDGEEAPVEGTVFRTMFTFTPPPAGHGNPLVNGGPDWSMEPILYDYFCDYSPQPEKTFKPSLLESYDFTDKVLTLKLRENLKWSDGSPITADDLLCDLYIDMTINKIAYYGDSVTKTDDRTVTIKFNTDSPLILDYVLKSPMRFSKKEYGKFSEEYKQVFESMRQLKDDGNYSFTKEGDEKISNVTTEINNYLPDVKSIVTSGPYVVETVTSSEMIFKRNPYYRNPLKIEKIQAMRPTSNESQAVSVMNKDFDGEGMGLSTDMAKKVAENNKDTIRQMVIPEYSELGFCFNVNKAPTDDVKVRKAIAYIIDKASIAPVSEPGMRLGDEYAVGLPPSIRDKYFDKEFLDTLENYTMDTKKAEELLKDAGWSKKGDKWVDANGESPEIKIAGVGEFPAYVVMGEAAANMLKDFGLNASFTPKESAAYSDYAISGDASMVIDGFGSTTSTQHPFEAYDALGWYGKRMNIKDVDKGEQVYKNAVTGEDFKYSEKSRELFQAKDDKEISEKAKEFAKFFNDSMWFCPITEKYYIYRIHNDKLSMAPAETGKELSDFYWSGTTSALLGKMLKAGQVYYVK
ncbi:peptide/nickel transport system substrate-binding protein [Clostridium sp. DSM 8431]|uniref:ABC transporter substrate-binding protein n=1 Tax=Clostridium sp. DSM 8431 TaxID=1761781 RepID=UPI0008E79AD7|nr:ABC transporter substrate-binding protein [Clostridium sp. DSM 8431]SFU56195.1 peptide/nickel transport system substrate-binding protein [Clostridium sp. DSM 8431]